MSVSLCYLRYTRVQEHVPGICAGNLLEVILSVYVENYLLV